MSKYVDEDVAKMHHESLTKREHYELKIAKALIISDRNIALMDIPKMANVITTKMLDKEYC